MRAVQGSWIRFACVSVILSASLTACGGGGSGGSTSTPQSSGGNTAIAPPASGGGNAAPQISGTAPTAVAAGQTYSFSPTATDPNQGDKVTFTISNKPAWAEFNAMTGLLSGKPSPNDVGAYHGIEIAATDGTEVSALPAFTIVVSPATANNGVSVAWTPPTQNDDGSTLTDLSGYKIHYGTTTGAYTDSVAVQNPGLTRYDLASLPKGQVYIAMTAVNAAGAESEYSPEVVVMVN